MDSKTSIRVLLADDHSLLRAGIGILLDRIENIEIVGEAGDGNEALRLIESTKPDIVLADIAMPGLSGLELTERVTANFPGVRVIILSMHETGEYVAKALLAGASGYLVKGITPQELEIAIRSVMAGGKYLTPSVVGHVVDAYVSSGRADSPLRRLTPRQIEILHLIADGKSTKDIAHILSVSPKTVEAHRSDLMERLGIFEVAGLVRYAIRAGLVEP